MRVTFNTQFRDAANAVAELSLEMATRQREISSGRRLHAPSDDPMASATSVTLRAQLAGADQYTRTATSAQSRLQVLDGVLSELSDLVTSAKVAAMSGTGSSATTAQREAAAQQLVGLRDSILAAVNTRVGGAYLLSGDELLTAPYQRVGESVSAYEGGSGVVAVDIDDETSVGLSLDGETILKGSDADDLFTTLDRLAADVRAGSDTGVDAGIEALGRGMARIGVVHGQVGLDLAAITSRSDLIGARRLAVLSHLSDLEDANLAESATALARTDTAYRATLNAIALSQRLSLLDYLR
ncbi:MAG: hypothetical protein AB1806_01560 [Acidobacteriota bacterium]